MLINQFYLNKGNIFTILLTLALAFPPVASWAAKLVIANNGAGQDFIENTLTALPLAVSDGAEIIELPVLMTGDDQLLVFSDLTLNRLTDVAMRFPDRHREDGKYYVIDFDLAEIRQLRLHNIFDNGPAALSLPIPTLNETLVVIRHLDTMFNRNTGLSIEPRYPQFHKDQGKDISEALLTALTENNVVSNNRTVFLQSPDADELQRLKDSLLPARNLDIPLIQLIRLQLEDDATLDNQADFSWIFTNSGLRLLALYASYLALPGQAVINSDGTMPLAGFIQEAHANGLKILATSMQSTDVGIETESDSLSRKLDQLFEEAELDGLFTDDFRSIINYLREKEDEVRRKNDLPPFFSNMHLARPKHDNQENTDSETQSQHQLPETLQHLESVDLN